MVTLIYEPHLYDIMNRKLAAICVVCIGAAAAAMVIRKYLVPTERRFNAELKEYTSFEPPFCPICGADSADVRVIMAVKHVEVEYTCGQCQTVWADLYDMDGDLYIGCVSCGSSNVEERGLDLEVDGDVNPYPSSLELVQNLHCLDCDVGSNTSVEMRFKQRVIGGEPEPKAVDIHVDEDELDGIMFI